MGKTRSFGIWHNSQTYVSTIGAGVASSAGTVPGSALVSTGAAVQTRSTVTRKKRRGRRHCRKHRFRIYNWTSCGGRDRYDLSYFNALFNLLSGCKKGRKGGLTFLISKFCYEMFVAWHYFRLISSVSKVIPHDIIDKNGKLFIIMISGGLHQTWRISKSWQIRTRAYTRLSIRPIRIILN